MQGKKCTRIDVRARLFSKISWGSMPPDPLVGHVLSPAPSKLPCLHICPPFLDFLNATLTCALFIGHGQRHYALEALWT